MDVFVFCGGGVGGTVSVECGKRGGFGRSVHRLKDSPVRDPLGQEAAEDGADAVGQPKSRQGEPVRRGAPLLCFVDESIN